MFSYNLEISQGSSFSLNITLTDDNGNPIDLTTSLVSGYIRKNYTSTGIVSLNPVVSSPPNLGNITLSIPYSGTQLLNSNIYVYDLFTYNTGQSPTNVTKVLRGYAYVYPDVTY